MGLFLSKKRNNVKITAFILLIAAFCFLFLLTGCGNEEDPRVAKPEEFTGVWEPSHLELGGKPVDLSSDWFKIELRDDMSGILTAGNETQTVAWEIRGFKGENVKVQIFVKLEKGFPFGGLTVEPKSIMFTYSTEEDSLSFEESWHQKVNGIDGRFTLAGTMQRAQ